MDKSCENCKYQHLSEDDSPCNECTHCYTSEWQPQTNADRIRAMSDEELAEFLPIVSNCLCRPTDKCMNTICNRGECEKTKECALGWLKAEAKGE